MTAGTGTGPAGAAAGTAGAAGLARLNGLAHDEAVAALLRCCGARRWAERVAAARPLADAAALEAASEAAFAALGREDWLEAFRAHPRIGQAPGARSATSEWSKREQAGALAADDAARRALAEGNAAYEARFGHIYIVCASGRGADEMLALLRARLANDPETELGVAAEEQRKITRLRLAKLLEETTT